MPNDDDARDASIYLRGWQDGAGGRELDPALSTVDEPVVAELYRRGHVDGEHTLATVREGIEELVAEMRDGRAE